MSRNILLSFIIHFAILAMTGLLYSIGNHPVFVIVVLLLVISGYTALGYVMLRPMKSLVANLLSVSLVSIVGFGFGLYAWMFPNQMGFNWMLFLGYYFYIFGFVDAFNLGPDPQVTFWAFIIPSLLMGIGLQFRYVLKRATAG